MAACRTIIQSETRTPELFLDEGWDEHVGKWDPNPPPVPGERLDRRMACIRRIAPRPPPRSSSSSRVHSVRFSRVRFSPDGTAAVQVWYTCHWNPGSSRGMAMFHLKREHGAWTVTHSGSQAGHCP